METNLLKPKTNSIVERAIYSKLCDKPIYCEIDNAKYILISGFLIPYLYCLVYCSALISPDINNDIRNIVREYEISFISDEYCEELRKLKLITYDTPDDIIFKVKSIMNTVLYDDSYSIFEFIDDMENQRNHYESTKI